MPRYCLLGHVDPTHLGEYREALQGLGTGESERELPIKYDLMVALMELARALAGQPRLLLLDETLAGLGQNEAEEVIAVLRQLAEDGITIVIIEHTMHLMVRLVDSFVVLDHGKVLTQGAPEAIIRDPRVIEAYLGKKWSQA